MNEVRPLTNPRVASARQSNLVNYRIALLPVALLFFLISCKEDTTLKKVCTDPIGSEDVTMQNNTQFCPREEQNGCFKVQLGGTTQIFPGDKLFGEAFGDDRGRRRDNVSW
ncbi:MAG: hypothetical protein WDN75_13895 [Bacteroidota bacterium]